MRERLQQARSSARLRATAGATLVVAIALVAGAWATLQLLEERLVDSLESTLETQAADRGRLLDSGADPASLPVVQQQESFVWIGTIDGTTVASSGLLLETPAELFAGGAVLNEAVTVTVRYSEPGYEDGSEEGSETSVLRIARAQSTQTAPNGQRLIVVTGAEDEQISDTLQSAGAILYAGVPLAIVLVVGVLWLALGRAFKPVEQIRQEADLISGAALDRRVPTSGNGDEIDRLADTMNSMLDRLAAHDRSQRQFASDASHELKTPVANLRALVETWNADQSDWPEQQDRLLGETDRMTALVDDLLFLSVRQEATVQPVRSRVHLDDIVFDEAGLLKDREGHRIDVSDVQPADIDGVPEDLRRAVRNLAVNAGRHAASTVWFSCRPVQHDGQAMVEIAVSDDGDGVAPERREAVFERFVRSEYARDRATGGTGLGLAITRQIVTAHGGSAHVDDHPSGGARFTLRFPAP